MKSIFFGKGERCVSCLRALLKAGYRPELIVLQASGDHQGSSQVAEMAQASAIPIIDPPDPNATEFIGRLQILEPDVFVLAGYGKILKAPLLAVPRLLSINLHGGKLPKYRGSSPMNWALINGDTSFSLSIICVDAGVDTGDVLAERSFPIDINHSIRDLQETANHHFPQMLVEVMRQVESGTLVPQRQDTANAGYYPLRFPADGAILWDLLPAEKIHNRIRALTSPYPCAHTWFEGREVKLLSSRLADCDYYGEPGRVYRISPSRGLLVCAADRCLWVREAFCSDNGQPLIASLKRYDRLATMSQTVASWHAQVRAKTSREAVA